MEQIMKTVEIAIKLSNAIMPYEQYLAEIKAHMDKYFPNCKYERQGKEGSDAFVKLI